MFRSFLFFLLLTGTNFYPNVKLQVEAYQLGSITKILPSSRRTVSLMMAKESKAVSRRRRRRGNEKQDDMETAKDSIEEKQSSTNMFSTSAIKAPAEDEMATGEKGKSIEEIFGLGDNQLKDLLEIELPVPREELISKKPSVEKEKEKQGKDQVFRLPDLKEFLQDKDEKETEQLNQPEDTLSKKVNRRNFDEYSKLLELNPFADADESLFVKEYDIIPSLFGSGKLLGIPVPYLQTGHGILLLICLLSGFVYAPGNPLTELPVELRDFIKTSLSVVYSINLVLAIQALFIAQSKSLPRVFWFLKTFIFGGIAFYEVKLAEDPREYNKPKAPQTRSQRRRNMT